MMAAGLLAHAGHAIIDHYVGNEISSPADNSMEQSDNLSEKRQRRLFGRPLYVRFVISHELEIDFFKHLARLIVNGDEAALPNADSAAENLHTYSNA